jgi:hypothetical protein
MVRSKRGLKLRAIDNDLADFKPGSCNCQVSLVVEELKGLINAEALKRLVILLFKSLSEREVGYLIAKTVRGSNRNVGVYG